MPDKARIVGAAPDHATVYTEPPAATECHAQVSWLDQPRRGLPELGCLTIPIYDVPGLTDYRMYRSMLDEMWVDG